MYISVASVCSCISHHDRHCVNFDKIQHLLRLCVSLLNGTVFMCAILK